MKKRRSGRGARLGQHFLRAPWAARTVAEAAHFKIGETVLEIGPGKGALTKELLARGAVVIAIEKDPELVAYLENRFSNDIKNGALTVLAKDIRDFDQKEYGLTPGSYALAANIPYYITGEILRSFISSSIHPHTMSLLVQKEVAERIARSKKESLLSLSVKVFGSPKIVASVSKKQFDPPPSVDSAILQIRSISRAFFSSIEERAFFGLLHDGFKSKRKQLAGNLSAYGRDNVLQIFKELGLSPTVRAEDVHLDNWKHLAEKLL